MKVIITPDAQLDFRAIVRWIGTDNLDRAEIFPWSLDGPAAASDAIGGGFLLLGR